MYIPPSCEIGDKFKFSTKRGFKISQGEGGLLCKEILHIISHRIKEINDD